KFIVSSTQSSVVETYSWTGGSQINNMIVDAVKASTGTVYNNSISETITSSDSDSGTANDISSISETATSSDTENSLVIITDSISETIISSDIYVSSGIFIHNNPISETISANDNYVVTGGTPVVIVQSNTG